MTTLQAFSEDALHALKRDHERLRYEVNQLRTMLRAFRCDLSDDGGTRGGCLAEDHPGRGVAFDIHLGIWDRNAVKWVYAATATVKAIDWRYGVPYPAAGATGLFERRPSAEFGSIWEVVPLDCDSPGACA